MLVVGGACSACATSLPRARRYVVVQDDGSSQPAAALCPQLCRGVLRPGEQVRACERVKLDWEIVVRLRQSSAEGMLCAID